ncbi:MAG: energy-coupling factor transporter ATPase [Clostridiales bacterium]|nr:energy-coupling factor transporter ATPase [Clostridiales bacterium]
MSISAQKINHIYSKGLADQTVALNDVSFDINDGEFVGIIGHTGSGKSTLLQHLNGLLKPDSGRIFINGRDITEKGVDMMEVRRSTGLVFQYPEYQLFEETVEKDIAFGPLNLGLSQEEAKDRAAEALAMVGLEPCEVAQKSPFDLSGGEKRRIAIAGVIAMKPRVLILDEPTAGLDPKAHKEILDMIEDIHKNEKNITILVSHKMDDIARLCDKILVMEKGTVVMTGTPQEIFSKGEELQAMGLDLPEAAQLILELKKRGIEKDETVLTMEQAERTLLEVLDKC